MRNDLVFAAGTASMCVFFQLRGLLGQITQHYAAREKVQIVLLFLPTHLRMDNGPEFIADALQGWCTGSGTGTAYIPPRITLGESIRVVVQQPIQG